MAEELSKKAEALHKKLIFGNILMAIVATVAAICMILLPCVDVRVKVDGKKVASYIEKTLNEDENATVEDEELGDILSSAFRDIELEIPINLYPIKLFKAATGDEKDIVKLADSLVGKDGSKKFVEDLVTQAAPSFASAALTNLIVNGGVSDEQATAYKEDVEEILQLLEAGENTAAQQEFLLLAEDVASENGSYVSSVEISALYDEIVKTGTNEFGTFDRITFVKEFDMRLLANGGGSLSDDLSENPMASIIVALEDLEKLVLDAINDSDLSLKNYQRIFIGIFFYTAGLPAILWAVLAISALIRIFTKKKKVKTWYVKLFCLGPGLGVLLLNGAALLLPKFIGGADAMALKAFPLSFLGSGAVTGVCYLLLLAIGWFGYKRICKKIRREEQAEDEKYAD